MKVNSSISRCLCVAALLGVLGLMSLLLYHSSTVRWRIAHTFSTSDRVFFRDALGVTRDLLLDYQHKHGSLPPVPDGVFQAEFVPPLSGFAEYDLQVEYADDARLLLDHNQPERVIVSFKLTKDAKRTVHILTSNSIVIQSISFDPHLWERRIAGGPVPYELLREAAWTNLGYTRESATESASGR